MLACYYLQGKQLASGVIGLLTCQSHYNVYGINRTPRARLLLRHPLDQRILTRTCACSVTRLRWNALIQRMTEEESGAWSCVDNGDVIVRFTGQRTNHATSKLFTLQRCKHY